MADETIADANPAEIPNVTAEPANEKPKARTSRKKDAPKTSATGADTPSKKTRTSKGTSSSAKAVAKAEPAAASTAERKRNKYTPAQRAAILASIEKATKGGKTTLKAALRQAEVSEQTYYNWKNAAQKATAGPVNESSGDELAVLVALEAENLRLRRELAAKLRAENEELRKRLGKV
ncbi:transposase [Brucella intermedia]|uniref:transposase n=1 Tax=Brucella TaxID=234 RepID=UPI0009466E40|nr:transposase [Brucella intermedia]